ncbi:MAG: hypothetical protein HQK84_04020 [Nitrospinae bacterium]|nr:hypothetical protein [Nitrospinota bacterium]
MKRILLLTFLTLFAFTSNALAYYVYDSKDFNVWLKTGNDNIIDAIKFTNKDKTKWVDFRIVNHRQLGGGGWTYTVKDRKGKLFYIDYISGADRLVVHSSNMKSKWTLYRRHE